MRAGLAPFALALVTLAAPLGCAPVRAPASPLEYTENARRAYDQALEAFFDHDWETATLLFEGVRRDFGYSRYSRLAALRLADIDYRQSKFPEAIGTYRAFIQDFPNDPEVPYARYKIVKALYEQAQPGLLVGPLEERDLAVVTDTYVTTTAFLGEYPHYQHAAELKHVLEVVTGTLARHELYVAHFYRREGNFKAAVARIQYSLREYPRSGLEPEGLVLLGETYMMMQERAKARQVLSEMLVAYPESAFIRPAKGLLALLGGPDPRVRVAPGADRAPTLSDAALGHAKRAPAEPGLETDEAPPAGDP